MLPISVEQSLVIAIGCIPPLRAVNKIQFPTLRSLSHSLVRIVGSFRSSNTKPSSRFHGASEHSTYQDLELAGAHIQDPKEPAVMNVNKNFSASGMYANKNRPAQSRDIRRTDAFTVSYGQPTAAHEAFNQAEVAFGAQRVL